MVSFSDCFIMPCLCSPYCIFQSLVNFQGCSQPTQRCQSTFLPLFSNWFQTVYKHIILLTPAPSRVFSKNMLKILRMEALWDTWVSKLRKYQGQGFPPGTWLIEGIVYSEQFLQPPLAPLWYILFDESSLHQGQAGTPRVGGSLVLDGGCMDTRRSSCHQAEREDFSQASYFCWQAVLKWIRNVV